MRKEDSRKYITLEAEEKTEKMIKTRKRKKLKIPAKASGGYLFALGASKLIGLCTTPLFTRIMSEGEYGRYILYVTVLGISSSTLTAMISGAVMYRGYERYGERKKEYTAASLGLSLCLIPIICTVVIIFGRYFGFEARHIFPLGAQLLFDAVLSAKIAEGRYVYSYRSVVVLSLLPSLLTPVISLALMRTSPVAEGRIFGLLIATLLLALPLFISITKKHKIWNKEMWSFGAKTALPILPGAFASALTASSDRLIISAYMGDGALAAYAVAHSIGVGLSFITGSLGGALYPWISRKLSSDNGEAAEELCGRVIVLLGAGALMLIAASPEALGLLAPKAYSAAGSAILPIALSTVVSFTVSILSLSEIHAGRSRGSGAASALGAAATLISNIVLIPIFSYTGAGFGLLIGNISAALLLYFSAWKSSSRPLIPLRLFAEIVLLTGALGAIISIFYESPIIRGMLLVIPFLLLLPSIKRLYGILTE